MEPCQAELAARVAVSRAFSPVVGEVGVAARGGELERDVPFGIVRQLLEPAVVGRTPRALAKKLRVLERGSDMVLAEG